MKHSRCYRSRDQKRRRTCLSNLLRHLLLALSLPRHRLLALRKGRKLPQHRGRRRRGRLRLLAHLLPAHRPLAKLNPPKSPPKHLNHVSNPLPPLSHLLLHLHRSLRVLFPLHLVRFVLNRLPSLRGFQGSLLTAGLITRSFRSITTSRGTAATNRG